MTSFVVDCSVVVQWYFSEPGGEHSLRLLDGSHRFTAPSLLRAEFANVCWKKARRGEITQAEAAEAIAAFPPAVVRLAHEGLYIADALQFALDNGITVYDSLYAVLALAGGAPLVTHDARLHSAVSAHDPALAIFPADLPA